MEGALLSFYDAQLAFPTNTATAAKTGMRRMMRNTGDLQIGQHDCPDSFGASNLPGNPRYGVSGSTG